MGTAKALGMYRNTVLSVAAGGGDEECAFKVVVNSEGNTCSWEAEMTITSRMKTE